MICLWGCTYDEIVKNFYSRDKKLTKHKSHILIFNHVFDTAEVSQRGSSLILIWQVLKNSMKFEGKTEK